MQTVELAIASRYFYGGDRYSKQVIQQMGDIDKILARQTKRDM